MAAQPVASASTVLDHNDAYFTLEQLKIEDSEELKKYMKIMELRPSSFSRLRILEAKKCDQELTKFLSILLRQSPGLEELKLANCELLEQVLNLGHLAPYEQEPPLFSNLRKMKLWDLPKLSCICNNDVKLGNLVELQIVKCGFLKGPLPTTLLAKLDFLMIESCEMMEQVVEENAEMQESLFLNLRFLQLVSLPKLTRFNSAHCHWTFPKLEGVWIEKCPELNAFSQAMNMVLLDTLKRLRLIGVPGILFFTQSNSRSLSKFSLRNLEEMEIVDCNHLQYVLAIEGLTTGKYKEGGLLFPALRTLGLRSLGKLRGIVKQDSLGRTLSFEMLTHLTVCRCNQLRYVLPLHVLQSLGKLENIEISDCKMLKAVFGDEDGTQMWKSDNIVQQLPQVKSLTLVKLPKFSGCCHDGSTVKWLSLERVRVVKCDMIQKSLLGIIARPVLTSMEVIECNPWANNEYPVRLIEYLFELTDLLDTLKLLRLIGVPRILFLTLSNSGSLSKFSLRNLEEMEIVDCNHLQYVLAIEGLTTGKNKEGGLLFPELRQLALRNLGHLRGIVKQDSLGRPLSFEMLTHLTVCSCNQLRYVLPLHVLQSLGKLENIEISDCEMLKGVFGDEDGTQMWKSDNIVHQLPQVKSLTLEKLPEFSGCSQDGSTVEWLSLERVRVVKCDMIQKSLLGIIARPVLTSMEVIECNPWANNEYPVRLIEYLFELTDLLETLKLLRLIGVPRILFLTLSNSGSLSKFSLRNLEEIEIVDCNHLQYVLAIEGLTTGKNKEGGLLFPELRQLALRNLGHLRGIVKQDSLGRPLSFEMLTHLTVCSCNQLRYVLPLHVLQSLGKLENIEISDCEMLKGVFGDEDGTQMWKSDNIVHQLPQVKSLTLEKLPEFSGCCQDGSTVEWLSLERVRVVKCDMIQKSSLGIIDRPLLKSVEVIEGNAWANNEDQWSHIEYLFELADELFRSERLKIEDSKELTKCMEKMQLSPFIFSRLKILEVRQCDQELTKFLSALLLRSHGLKELTVENCKMVEQVFNLKEAHDKQVPRILFPDLVRMRLCGLPALNCISNNDVKLGNLVQLEIVKCGLLKGPLPTTLLAKLHELKIESCEKIEQVIEDYTEMQERSFLNLTDLKLASLPELIKFTSSHCNLSFPNLRNLRIEKCPKLKMFTEDLLLPSSYPELTKIDISDCQSLKDIFIDTGIKADEKCFPNLESIVLENLPVLSSFSLETFRFPKLQKARLVSCPAIQTFSWSVSAKTSNFMDKDYIQAVSVPFRHGKTILLPQLQVLELSNLPKMQLWNQEPQMPVFEKMTSLRIIGCGSIEKLFSISVAKHLSSLKLLTLYKCENMVQVLYQGGRGTGKQVFEKLETLVLKHLPRLTSFCEEDVDFGEFPQLKMIRVEDVPSMNTFVKQPLKTPKLKQVHVTFIRKCWLGNLNKTITFLHEIQDQLKEKVWESNQSNNTSYEAESSAQGKFEI